MKKRKQNKLLKAVSKGKTKRVLHLCKKLGYGPEVKEELLFRAYFNGYEPQMEPRKHPL